MPIAVNQMKKKMFICLFMQHLSSVHAASAISATAHRSRQMFLRWKDDEVFEDIKFASESLQRATRNNKAQYDRANSLETADGSKTSFIVWKLADTNSLGNITRDK